MYLAEKISAAFLVFLIAFATFVVFSSAVASTPEYAEPAEEPITNTRVGTVPYIDVDDNDTATDHDGFKITYRSSSASPVGTYMIRNGEASSALYETANVQITLNGEGDAVSGGESGFGPVDVVFVCDDTGSMSSYISQAASDMSNIIQGLEDAGVTDMRFGIVTYKDGDHDYYHSPRDSSYAGSIGINVATDLYLTKNKAAFVNKLSTLTSSGGADGPEGVVDGLQYAYDTWKHYDDIYSGYATPTAKYTSNSTMNWDTYRNGQKVAHVVTLLADAPPHSTLACKQNATQAYNEFDIVTNAIACRSYANSTYYQPPYDWGGTTMSGGALYDIAQAGKGVYSTANNPTYVANAIAEGILKVAERLATAGKWANLSYELPDYVTMSGMSNIPLQVTPASAWNTLTGTVTGPAVVRWYLGDNFAINDQMTLSWDIVSRKASASGVTNADVSIGNLTLDYYAWSQASTEYDNHVSVKMGEGYLPDKSGGATLWQEKKVLVKAISSIDITDNMGADGPYSMTSGATKNIRVAAVRDQTGSAGGNDMIPFIDWTALDWNSGGTTAGTCTPGTGQNTVFTAMATGTVACESGSGIRGSEYVTVPQVLSTLQLYTYENPTAPCDNVHVTAGKTQRFVAKGFDTAGQPYTLSDTDWTAMMGMTDVTVSTVDDPTDTTQITFTAPLSSGSTVTLTAQDSNGTGTPVSDSITIHIDAGNIAHIVVVPDTSAEYGAGPASPGTYPMQFTTAQAGTASRMFKAFAYDEHYNQLPATTFTWTTTVGSMTPSSATISTLNAQSALTSGYVYASKGGVTGRAGVDITPGVLSRIEVIPNNVALIVGGKQQFTARGYDASGNLITGWTPPTANWTASIGTLGSFTGNEFTAVDHLSGSSKATLSVTITDEILVGSVWVPLEGNGLVTVINPYDVWIERAEVGPFAKLTSETNIELYATVRYDLPPAATVGATVNVDVKFQVDGGAIQTQTLTLTADTSGAETVTVTVPSPASTPGKHELKVWIEDGAGNPYVTGSLANTFESDTRNNEVTSDLHLVEPYPNSTPGFDPGIVAFLMMFSGIGLAVVYFTKNSQKNRRKEEAVSPVVAVILMVAITLVIIAILWLWISTMISTPKTETPQVEVRQGMTSDDSAYEITIQSIDDPTVSVTDVRVVLYSPSGEDQYEKTSLDNIYGDKASATNIVVYHDNDYNGKVSVNDKIVIYSGADAGMPGGRVSLYFLATNKKVCNDVILL